MTLTLTRATFLLFPVKRLVLKGLFLAVLGEQEGELVQP